MASVFAIKTEGNDVERAGEAVRAASSSRR
jgi:hypothetical protein